VTWEVRAVDQTGALVSVVAGVDVRRVVDELNGRESATLSIPTLHPDATHLDLFESEVQLWLDGEFRGWYVPTTCQAANNGSSDTLTVELDSLFLYFHEVVVGGLLPNLIVSPHEEADSLVGFPPNYWTATGDVDDVAVVDNNATFWQTPVAIQVNNGESDQDAYIYQRYTVPAELDRVPMFAAAEVYIADGDGTGSNPPPWGRQAMSGRGLMIHRLDGTTLQPVSAPQIARITDETPRNEVVTLQTPGVLPLAGEVVEVRCYAPAAWTVWRFVHMRDDRAISADRVDKSVAVTSLVSHAQDTAIGKYDHNIDVDVVDLGQIITASWPWWRRDVIGEQIEDLASTFEFTMIFAGETVDGDWDEGVWDEGVWDGGTTVVDQRAVQVREQIGTDLSGTVTLTKADMTGWDLGMSRAASANRVIRQGEGSGAARFEWWTDDTAALNGQVREVLTFGAPGELLGRLRDNATEELGRRKVVPKLLTARIGGDDRRPDLKALARSIRAGDTVAVDLDHGWAQYAGNARVMRVELDGVSMVATVDLEPVT
jgi:hypothetical protein